MKLRDFLIQVGRPVSYYPKLAKFLGSVKAAIFVCQLGYWLGKEGEEGWIYKSMKEMGEETGLSRHEQDGARQSLKGFNLLQEKLKGMPATLHYKIDWDRLNEQWEKWVNSGCQDCTKPAIQFAENRQSSLPKTGKLVCGKPPNKFAGKGQTIYEHRLQHRLLQERALKNKKSKKQKSLKEMAKKFRSEYGDNLVDEFLDYWTEKNENGKLERWQKQDTFEISRRLKKWKSNHEKWGKENKSNNGIKILRDGSKAKKIFGVWYDADNPGVKIDLSYYPELKE